MSADTDLDVTTAETATTDTRESVRLTPAARDGLTQLVADGLFASRAAVVREGLRAIVVHERRPAAHATDTADARLSIRLPAHLDSEVERLAGEAYPSRSHVVRAAIWYQLDRYDVGTRGGER